MIPLYNWVGGKRSILEKIREHLPFDFKGRLYIEPFLGGGAVFLGLRPERAFINDRLEPLINFMMTVRDDVDFIANIYPFLKKDRETYYQYRTIFNSLKEGDYPLHRAVLFLYLIKNGHQGQWRCNKQGRNNTSYGYRLKGQELDLDNLFGISEYLNSDKIRLLCGDFTQATRFADEDSFVYLDPPYPVTSKDGKNMAYGGEEWGVKDLNRVRRECDRLTDECNCPFLLSLPNIPLVSGLFERYTQEEVLTHRPFAHQYPHQSKAVDLLINNYKFLHISTFIPCF